MFPFHTWLPDAHVEAPTPISVILAGVLLKMGIYGILRFNCGILPDATALGGRRHGASSASINIVYGAFVCLAQKDLKKLIAYSSVSHMGFCLLGMAALTPQGITGAVLPDVHPRHHQPDALPHRRRHLRPRPPPRDRAASAAWPRRCPSTPAIMGLAFLASLGLPGPGRLHLRVPGLLGRLPGLHASAPSSRRPSVIITAAYYLWAIQRMFLGKLNEAYAGYPDLNWRERLTLYPLARWSSSSASTRSRSSAWINATLHGLVQSIRPL